MERGTRRGREERPRAARSVVLGAVLGALALAACATAGPAQPGPEPGADPGAYLYVPNQDDATISVVDTESRTVVRTIDLQELGFPPDAKPHDVVVEPDGSAWYVSLIGANVVLRFDAAGELLARAEFEAPGMMALHPTEDVLYVGRSMKAVNPPQRIGRVETADMSIREIEVLFPRPHAIAAGPGGDHVHVGSLSVNRIAALETGSDRVTLVDVDGPVHVFVQFAVSPDGERMVATGQVSGRLLVFDRTRPAELPRVATVEVGAQPWHPSYTPDGRLVVFGNKEDDTVTIVDARTWEVVGVVADDGLSQPHGSAVSADGRYAYVSNNNLDGDWTPPGWSGGEEGASPPGSVAVIDLERREVVDVIPVGRNPNGLGLGPKP